MCDAPWVSGCKKQDLAVILQNTKGGKLLVCHECWKKVPKTWKWGPRKRRTRAEIAVDVIDALEEEEVEDLDKTPLKEKAFDNYVPFAKKEGKVVAWIRKDILEKMKKASKEEMDEIMKEGEKSLRDEVNRSKKRRKKRGKRRKKRKPRR